MVSLETVYEALRHWSPKIYLNVKSDSYINDVVILSKDKSMLKTTLLYVCTSDQLPELSMMTSSLNILCIAKENIAEDNLGNHHNFILVNSTELMKVYEETNAIISDRIRIFRGEKRICEALLSGKGLQHIVDVGLDVLGNPFFVSDLSFKILARTHTEVDDRSWNEATNTEIKYNEIARQLRKSSEIEKLYNSDAPVLSEFSYSKYKWLACRIMVAGKVIGHAAMIEYLKPLRKSDTELLKIFCKALASEIQKENFPNYVHGVKYEFLLADILDDKLSNRKIAEERMKILNIKFKERLYVLVSRLSPKAPGNTSIPYIRNLMERMVGDSKTIIYHNHIVMIVGRHANNPLTPSDLGNISALLADNQIDCGLSRCFGNIGDLKEHYVQALKAIDIGTRIDKDKDLYFYEDYSFFHLLELAAGQKELDSFCSPLLTQLREYDRKNATDYTKSLYVYLSCGCDLHKAAEQFKIHRNSMNYRINKITEILDTDIDDPEVNFSLYLSFKILIFNEGINAFRGKGDS
ncbi:helix-turn-helix domain-containing protein [Dehalobacter sp. DCM]|uniref:PucR family transcriptional regulator n=1 Tax=Dehalobacter sp. DCM TaxID=2907827 RepID=UPI0030815702|nr:helix-turn-helix domain-containing protein [Dehalobacter sp. DCM]